MFSAQWIHLNWFLVEQSTKFLGFQVQVTIPVPTSMQDTQVLLGVYRQGLDSGFINASSSYWFSSLVLPSLQLQGASLGVREDGRVAGRAAILQSCRKGEVKTLTPPFFVRGLICHLVAGRRHPVAPGRAENIACGCQGT